MTNHLLHQTLQHCSPDMQAEIAYRLAAREAQAQTWRNLAYRLETILTTGVVTFTLANLMIPGLNQTTTNWYSAQTWLNGAGQVEVVQAAQAIAPQDNAVAQKVVAIATSRVGQSFKPGEKAQCAYFLRDVLREAGASVEVTTNPKDGALPVNEGHANSFFGEDVGDIIEKPDELRPGDLVMFLNTYGDFPPGTVTHVGVYVGDGQMVDRATSDAPVQKRSISGFQFAAGVRPHGYAKAQPVDRPKEVGSAEAQQYFSELKGFEFSANESSPNANARIEILGNPTEADLKTVEEVTQELRSLGAVGIEIVASGGDVKVHFADPAEFSKIEPDYKEGNLGFFSASSGNVLIATGNLTQARPHITQQERSHIIREEMTQLISGLGKDSMRYPDSIFYEPWTDVTQYSELDKAVIRMAFEQ